HHAAGHAGLRRDIPVLRGGVAGRLERAEGAGAGGGDRGACHPVSAGHGDRAGVLWPRRLLVAERDAGVTGAGRSRGGGRKLGRVLNARSIIGIVIGLALLALFLYPQDLNALGQSLSSVSPVWIVPSIAIYFLGIWFRAARWRLLMAPFAQVSTTRLFRTILC